MHGWDHHCVALNNCVGVRNLRSFVSFLIISFTFALSVAIICLIVLFKDRDYSESTWELHVGAGAGLAIALLTFILTIKPWFKNKIRFSIALFGIILALTVTMIFCRDTASFVAATFVYIAFGYMMVIRHMLNDYIGLVSSHLNNKERVARK